MFVLSLLLASCALGLQLDIHLVPSPHTGAAVTRLARMAPHNQIDFVATSQAHVTLYLTDFVDAQVRREVFWPSFFFLTRPLRCRMCSRRLSKCLPRQRGCRKTSAPCCFAA